MNNKKSGVYSDDNPTRTTTTIPWRKRDRVIIILSMRGSHFCQKTGDRESAQSDTAIEPGHNKCEALRIHAKLAIVF